MGQMVTYSAGWMDQTGVAVRVPRCRRTERCHLLRQSSTKNVERTNGVTCFFFFFNIFLLRLFSLLAWWEKQPYALQGRPVCTGHIHVAMRMSTPEARRLAHVPARRSVCPFVDTVPSGSPRSVLHRFSQRRCSAGLAGSLPEISYVASKYLKTARFARSSRFWAARTRALRHALLYHLRHVV